MAAIEGDLLQRFQVARPRCMPTASEPDLVATHRAFYTGWPHAFSALPPVKGFNQFGGVQNKETTW